jgi:hypothetical protein
MIRDEKYYVPFPVGRLFSSEAKSIRQGERKEDGGVRGRWEVLGSGEQALISRHGHLHRSCLLREASKPFYERIPIPHQTDEEECGKEVWIKCKWEAKEQNLKEIY